jgi:hypothetical protein
MRQKLGCTKNTLSFIMIISFLVITFHSQGQNILIEEFTNLNAPDYHKTHKFIEGITSKMKSFKYVVIKYHTDFPMPDTFNIPVKKAVISRLASLESFDNVPTTIIDSKIMPTGLLNRGHTLNLTSTFLDSLVSTKTIKPRFFGFDVQFSDDFKTLYGSSGIGSSPELVSKTVRMSRMLLERNIEMDIPNGLDTIQSFDFIFRGLLTYRQYISITQSFSHHGGGAIAIPKDVQSLSNLYMAVILEDIDGKVIDCQLVRAPFVDYYNIETTNITLKQDHYCTNKVTPKINIKNKCPYIIKGFNIQVTINDSIIPYVILEDLHPGTEKTYTFDEIVLSSGRNDIDIYVDSIHDANKDVNINKTNKVDSLFYFSI